MASGWAAAMAAFIRSELTVRVPAKTAAALDRAICKLCLAPTDGGGGADSRGREQRQQQR